MTYAEAKKKVIDSGYEGEPTPEVIKLAGWDYQESIRNTVALGESKETIGVEQLKLDVAALVEEAKANDLPANIASYVGSAIGLIKKFGII